MNISAELGNVRGEPAGIPKLVLDFRVKNNSDSNVGIVTVKAEIRPGTSMIDEDIRKCPFLGYGELEDPPGQLSKGAEQNWRVAQTSGILDVCGLAEGPSGDCP